MAAASVPRLGRTSAAGRLARRCVVSALSLSVLAGSLLSVLGAASSRAFAVDG